MNPKLSILTPCSRASVEYLSDAGASVEELRSKADYSVEWVICLDGKPEGQDSLPCLPDHILVETPEKWGVAAARNQTLVNASGDFVFPLDADDVLVPDGLIKAIKCLEENPGYHWVSGNCLYLNNGLKTPHWIDTPEEWAIGSLGEAWTVLFPFHPNCTVVNREIAQLVGGYPALPTKEDLAFLFRLGRVSKGISLVEVILKYREHEAQITNQPQYFENKALAFDYIVEVENVWRANNDLPAISAPDPTAA